MEILRTNTLINKRISILYQIGKGSFADVYICLDNKHENTLVALKATRIRENKISVVTSNEAILLKWANGEGIPRYMGKGMSINLKLEFIIMEALGPSLDDLLFLCGGKFTLKTTLMLFDQLIRRFRSIHDKGVVHCDIKPHNILMGIGKKSHTVYLIDYGLANFIFDLSGEHIAFKKDSNLIGTVRFSSPNSHEGYELSRRDDLIALGYLIYYVYNGSLPWQNDVDP